MLRITKRVIYEIRCARNHRRPTARHWQLWFRGTRRSAVYLVITEAKEETEIGYGLSAGALTALRKRRRATRRAP